MKNSHQPIEIKKWADLQLERDRVKNEYQQIERDFGSSLSSTQKAMKVGTLLWSFRQKQKQKKQIKEIKKQERIIKKQKKALERKEEVPVKNEIVLFKSEPHKKESAFQSKMKELGKSVLKSWIRWQLFNLTVYATKKIIQTQMEKRAIKKELQKQHPNQK